MLAASGGDRALTIWTWLRPVARPVFVGLGLALVLAGCQIVPGDGPWMGGAQASSTEALPFDVIDLTPTSVVAFRPLVSVDKPSTTSNLSAAGSISVAPGDVLRVRIFEPYAGSIFPTIQQPGADLGAQRVTDAGTITVPYVGTVPVAGLDLSQIEQRIAERLKGKAQDPQVIVEFVADRSHTVMISGDVRNPGRISILDGVRSVLDAINRAGGPNYSMTTPSANQVEVIVRRHGEVILTTQFSDLLAGADIAIQKNDEIVLRHNAKTFTVLGAVTK